MDLISRSYELHGVNTINVILGKNGCGKSTLLKDLESSPLGDEIGIKNYVTPERGGVLLYDPGVDNTIARDPDWVRGSRLVNQFAQFKQQSATQFRQLEFTVLREAEKRNEPAKFQPLVDSLNGLLDNIEIRRTDQAFKLYDRTTQIELSANAISSGESELIALGIEILMFSKRPQMGKTNLLLLDEPDVHLHPDLQSRLMTFLCSTVFDSEFSIVIATHSTAILGGLADYPGGTVAFMKSGSRELDFKPIDEVHRRILPVFGAHPLSNVFNKKPVLVLEGDDDIRVWQKAVATSNGDLHLYPTSCESVSAMGDYEKEVDHIISCVYENGVAYSLRDGDGKSDGTELEDLGAVRRLRLKCRASENLMLADECLIAAGVTYPVLQEKVNDWLEANVNHSQHGAMLAFRESGFDRKDHDLKQIRMILIGQILGSNKPWEVLVGQVLGNYSAPEVGTPHVDGTLAHFLGDKILSSFFVSTHQDQVSS